MTLPHLPNLKIKGPFWSADAAVIKLGEPQEHWAFRSLLVDIKPRNALKEQHLLLPGTVIALCFVREVRVVLGADAKARYVWQRGASEKPPDKPSLAQMQKDLASGQLALLLLQADPEAWPAKTNGPAPEFTCTAGEISLDTLKPISKADERLYKALTLTRPKVIPLSSIDLLPGVLSVHSSGLSLYGQIRLPWWKDPIGAPFQLAQVLPTTTPPAFRLTIEAERLAAHDTNQIIKAWSAFSSYVNPGNPLLPGADASRAPAWATLEVAHPKELPRMYWRIAAWQEAPQTLELHWERGEINLLLSDRSPYAQPTSLARIAATMHIPPDRPDSRTLRISLQAGDVSGSPTAGRLTYTSTPHAHGWNESFTLAALDLAFSPLETPRLLRDAQELPTPAWAPSDKQLIESAVVWGFMPLEDGWAQLPVPNLTEQIYLDAELDQIATQPTLLQNPVWQGAVAYGNDRVAGSGGYADEQPWSMTLTNARGLQGTWVLSMGAGPPILASISLTITSPEVVLNGILWLSADKPTLQDALPSFDNWVDPLRAVPLRTVTSNDVYPAPVVIALQTLTFTMRAHANQCNGATPTEPIPLLGAWSFIYRAQADLVQRLIAKHVLPQHVFSAPPADSVARDGVRRSGIGLVWRQHATLPVIQALPMTQRQSPPNYPSPSRQLAPYELPVTAASPAQPPLPADWHFGGDGATAWAQLRSSATLAREWTSVAGSRDLGLALLSLPGLAWEPTANDSQASLRATYRWDIPITDELNALAQTPTLTPDPSLVAPLPTAPAPTPPTALLRDDLHEHWARLAESASLARADAVEAFVADAGVAEVRHLIEPATWSVKLALDLDQYPGALEISNGTGPAATLRLTDSAALRGIHGRFALNNNLLRRLMPDEQDKQTLIMEAGSMAAGFDAAGALRDQRGLARAATRLADNLLRTPITLDSAAYELASLLQPLSLRFAPQGMAAVETWCIWFRDLPIADGSFDWKRSCSKRSQDINDPAATAREYNHLSAFEWRLAHDHGPDAPLYVYGLRFYPLTLEAVECTADRVTRIDLIGRLQLPLKDGAEQQDLSNAVRLQFAANDVDAALDLAAVSLESTAGEWPLALTSGETTDAPRLTWRRIALSADRTALHVDDATLSFLLFDIVWNVKLSRLSFALAAPSAEITHTVILHPGSGEPLTPQRAALTIDMATLNHTVVLTLAAHISSRPSLASSGLQALYVFNEGSGATIHDVSGVGAPLDLHASDAHGLEWQPDGLRISAPVTIASATPATKIIEACRAANEITIEAWIRPRDLSQTSPMRIVTLSADVSHRNVTLQQGAFQSPRTPSTFYHARLRTTTTDPEGMPAIATPPGSTTQQLTHIIYTRAASGETRIYLNGAQQASGRVSGTFANWDATYRLMLTNEISGDRPWLGEYRMVAIYDRALTEADVAQRFAAGPTITPITQRGAFTAEVTIDLMKRSPDNAAWVTGKLFDDLQLATQLDDLSSQVLLADNTLQFAWRFYTPVKPDAQLQVLPGMYLTDRREAPGFATFTFTVEDGPFPTLRVTTAFVEALLLCHWGAFLQTNQSAASASAEQVWGSSAGDIAVGYTAQYQNDSWDESLLFNGFLEVKDLISWPYNMSMNASGTKLTAPAARPNGSAPALSHYRHTIRILFNQHLLPSDLLLFGRDQLLFVFDRQRSWQFLAVVEHQIIEVDPGADGAQPMLGADRRWTVVQEVRLTTPATFKQFLDAQRTDAFSTISALDRTDDLGDINGGYWGVGLRTRLAGPGAAELDLLQAETLIVEASALHWIKQTHLETPSPTTLQFLPGGSQLGLLSAPHDFAPSAPDDPRWLLLATPFLGRLQAQEHDELSPQPGASHASSLQIDPVLQLLRTRTAQPKQALPDLALALTTWGDAKALQISAAAFEGAAGRTWARLDPLSLEESWFRIQNPLSESETTRLQSVTASLPATPARLSRALALRYAFDAQRRRYPPERADSTPPEELPATAALVWRQQSLLLVEGVTSISAANKPPYGWHLTALQLATSRLLRDMWTDAAALTTPLRYPAATVIPALLIVNEKQNAVPVSFAVSPYLGLEFRLSGQRLKLRLVAAELLCIERGSRTLRPVASYMWERPPTEREVQPDAPEDQWQQAEAEAVELVRQAALAWAQATRIRLCPDSPTALLRFREIRDNVDADERAAAPLTTTYAFALVPDPRPPQRLARRVFRIRAQPDELRFRQGQYGGSALPRALQPFEVAPPQTIGVQPFYLPRRPVTFTPQDWPWGLSALRVSVRYSDVLAAAIGSLWQNNVDSALTLWWQALQHHVQYRSSTSSEHAADLAPVGGLPNLFRGPAIKSLLPIAPDLAPPTLDMRALVLSDAELHERSIHPDSALEHWQPVLPGLVRYLLIGARPGVLFALRSLLLRQTELRPQSDWSLSALQTGALLVSGSVPVQHRMPRAVPLPANQPLRQNRALQTWASYYEPEHLLIADVEPVDEAFLAPLNNRSAQRLRLQLAGLVRATLSATWDSALALRATVNGLHPNGDGQPSTVADWMIEVELTDGQQTFRFVEQTSSGRALRRRSDIRADKTALDDTAVGRAVADAENVIRFVPIDTPAAVQAWIGAKVPGARLWAKARVSYLPANDGFFQTLAFPLRVADPSTPSLPLDPHFVYFEDPEYNRRLASSAYHASQIVKVPHEVQGKVEQTAYTVTLAIDRREYNADSRIALRYDWDDNGDHGTASLEFRRVDTFGIPTKALAFVAPNPDQIDNLPPHTLVQLSLLDLRDPVDGKAIRWSAGDILQIKLIIQPDKPQASDPDIPGVPIILSPMIVAAPVMPAPEAAYALLRHQTRRGRSQVECARFAWGPAPTRVELVCPDDLRAEIVRRRAVFQWSSVARPASGAGYALQKITPTGATHIPQFATFEPALKPAHNDGVIDSAQTDIDHILA